MTALRFHSTAMAYQPGHRAMIDPRPLDQRSPFGRRLRAIERRQPPGERGAVMDLCALLKEAAAQGWKRATLESPEPGQRVEVMHVLTRQYDTDGEVDEIGVWSCANGFILPNMTFTLSPTHWRPMESPQ